MRGRQQVDEHFQPLIVGEIRVGCLRLGGRQEPLPLGEFDPRILGEQEIQELPRRRLHLGILEHHHRVGHRVGGGRGPLGHRHDAVIQFRRFLGNLVDQERCGDHHADAALLEQILQILAGIIGRTVLGQPFVDERFVHRQRLHASRRIERRLHVGADHIPAIAPQRVIPIHIDLGALGHQPEAGLLHRLQLLRRRRHVIPGRRAIGEARLGQHLLVVIHRARRGRDRQPIGLAIDDRGLQERPDEAILEVGGHVAVERLGDVVLDEIQQPARADDRDVGIGAAGDVGAQLLQQSVPVHHIDLDVDIRVLDVEFRRHLLKIRPRRGAVIGHRHMHGLRAGRLSHRRQRRTRQPCTRQQSVSSELHRSLPKDQRVARRSHYTQHCPAIRAQSRPPIQSGSAIRRRAPAHGHEPDRRIFHRS
jgi:hypothetical protein